MSEKPFKRINGKGKDELDWTKIKEALIIGIGVSILSAGIIGGVAWLTSDRAEIKRDLLTNRELLRSNIEKLIDSAQVQEFNQIQIAERVNSSTELLYSHLDQGNRNKIPCPSPVKLKTSFGIIGDNLNVIVEEKNSKPK